MVSATTDERFRCPGSSTRVLSPRRADRSCHHLPGRGVSFAGADPSVHGASTKSPGGAFGTSTRAAGLSQTSAGLAVNRRTANTLRRLRRSEPPRRAHTSRQLNTARARPSRHSGSSLHQRAYTILASGPVRKPQPHLWQQFRTRSSLTLLRPEPILEERGSPYEQCVPGVCLAALTAAAPGAQQQDPGVSRQRSAHARHLRQRA